MSYVEKVMKGKRIFKNKMDEVLSREDSDKA